MCRNCRLFVLSWLVWRIIAEPPVEETAGNEAGNAAGNTALMDSVGVKDSVAIAVKDTVSKKLIAEPVIKQQEAPLAVKQTVVAATSASQPKKQKKVEYVPILPIIPLQEHRRHTR